MYLFSYFKEEQESLFLALSEDGYTWRELNDGSAVYSSSIGTGQIRDPFIWEDGQGAFHLIWTDGWRSRSIGYARSTDLVHWEDEKLIPVMEHLPETQNTWAPEIFFDTVAGSYRIVWSSTVGVGPRNHRIWSATTTDFKTFTEAKLFLDPGYNVIDANVTDIGDHYVMFFKDERGANEKGTEFKAIRLCYLTKQDGDRPEVEQISHLITPALTEGPTLYAVERDGSKEWILLVDGFQEQYYGAYRSRDLEKWESIGDEMRLPRGARHGSVIRLRTSVANLE
ncbi:glycoside hydrolase family 43 protein [Paenibacillus alginolyticus]|uniref:Glycoside hydrolase family 43 protein n=1 Tax=Paenibacillus alginolyticus TaxID=59839 RepID=A0ABT4GMI3_9BACL|nr:glycoside hydrolase family 43 protein [Paenibacillus alginolyticus]MCY9697392.1 glycoside hydrolase family 43 protein [Paenibacillus alginolyticus]MEC0146240.1 glycoside hydrolase family 43 protein [Paenibacillus alginolyticus]